MIEPARIHCQNLEISRRFYAAAVKPLGLALVDSGENCFAVAYMVDGAPVVLEVVCSGDAAGLEADMAGPERIALEAPDDYTVRAFYRAALEAGGKSTEYPAPQFNQPDGQSYYCARVCDPEGHEVEVGWRH